MARIKIMGYPVIEEAVFTDVELTPLISLLKVSGKIQTDHPVDALRPFEIIIHPDRIESYLE